MANFKKSLLRQDGDIEVSIKFSKSADYENITEDDNGDTIYNIEPTEFIEKLINNKNNRKSIRKKKRIRKQKSIKTQK